MNTQIQQTSLEAFETVKPYLPTNRSIVYNTLSKFKDLTNMELAKILDWDINRVTPRVFELRQQRLVIFSQVRKCDITGRDVTAWKVATIEESRYGEIN